jgi:signal transduction histidine kinase
MALVRRLDTMVNRVFLILALGIVLSAGLTGWLSQRERQRSFHNIRAVNAADRIDQYIGLLDSAPPGFRDELIKNTRTMGLATATAKPAVLPTPVEGEEESSIQEHDQLLSALLSERLGADRVISVRAGLATVKLLDGSELGLRPLGARRGDPRYRASQFWGYQLGFMICVMGLAYLVARLTTDPLLRLAQAALELGRDIDRQPLPEAGPREIRHATRAFNLMQSRLSSHIQQRNQMLAAISHDLQTPLTRMRLRLEKVTDEQLQEKLLSDLSAMQSLVAEGLAVARSVESREPLVKLNLASLLDSLVEDAREAGQPVEFSCEIQPLIKARPNDLKRCLTNLIDNAVKYGKVAKVSVQRAAAGSDAYSNLVPELIIRIADEGPGIPSDKLEAVFEPFHRLEHSRSRDTGGSGVGLTIARNIAQRHGGDLWLENGTQGLVALLRLPCEPS